MPATQLKPEPVSVATTPSGIEIAYFLTKKPKKRWYEIRRGNGKWKVVPSVTEVLDVLNKAALPWWGMRVGFLAVSQLINVGLLRVVQLPSGVSVLACAGPTGEGESGLIVAGVPQIEELAKQFKMTTNDVRDKAGDRGQAVHDAFETWAKNPALVPDPAMYPLEEQGYVEGLRKFIEESGAKPVANEVMVGSYKHGYAGRYDVDLLYENDVDLVVHRTPVRGEQRARHEAGLYLDDLKTSKDVYDTHFKQLEGYEEARIECGYVPTKGRGVIHVDANGNYKRVPSPAIFADFKSTLGEWKAQDAMKKRKKEAKAK